LDPAGSGWSSSLADLLSATPDARSTFAGGVAAFFERLNSAVRVTSPVSISVTFVAGELLAPITLGLRACSLAAVCDADSAQLVPEYGVVIYPDGQLAAVLGDPVLHPLPRVADGERISLDAKPEGTGGHLRVTWRTGSSGVLRSAQDAGQVALLPEALTGGD